jgi:hypothetical protein
MEVLKLNYCIHNAVIVKALKTLSQVMLGACLLGACVRLLSMFACTEQLLICLEVQARLSPMCRKWTGSPGCMHAVFPFAQFTYAVDCCSELRWVSTSLSLLAVSFLLLLLFT